MLEGSIHVVSSVFFLANQGKISPSAREVQTPQQEFIAPNCSDTIIEWGLRCQVASSDKGIFVRFLLHKAVFLLVFYCFDSFLNSFRQ
jgi:hypothetical protein